MFASNSLHPEWFIIGSLAVAFLPLFLGVLTSYLKVSVVLSMLRSGLGAQNTPSALVTMALSLGLTLSIMAPVFQESKQAADRVDFSLLQKKPTKEVLETFAPVVAPWMNFLKTHAGEREREVFMAKSEMEESGEVAKETNKEDLQGLLLAFLTGELKEAFAIGFVVLLPFLVVDLIVANLLVGLGMFMVSPVMIALPLKLLLFVLADGWVLLTQGLLHSYATL
ncbi:MAG: EscR/YscR/HrcR family type III secretion system export apparatus protein [Bdellovibrionales bacterium]|nr:EscR/YscR/HrcR family type III secretion system export apparatus protein [Bdellovibrionales bacterium]